MKTKAVGFRVHVKPDVSETEKQASKAGFILPDTHDRKADRQAVDTGVVLELGPTAFEAFGGTPWVQAGDRVVYARHAGYAVGIGEEKVLVINDEDVVCKLED